MRVEVIPAAVVKAVLDNPYGGEDATDGLQEKLYEIVAAELSAVQGGESAHIIDVDTVVGVARYYISYHFRRGDGSGIYIYDAAPPGTSVPLTASRLEIGWWISPVRVVHLRVAAARFVHKNLHSYDRLTVGGGIGRVYPELTALPDEKTWNKLGRDTRDMIEEAIEDPTDPVRRAVVVDAMQDDRGLAGKDYDRMMKLSVAAAENVAKIIQADKEAEEMAAAEAAAQEAASQSQPMPFPAN